MTVLVTGGTGYVGGAVVRSLVARGERVRVLARRTSKVDGLAALGVQIAYGDILDRQSIGASLQGCDTLYHIAALYDFWVADKAAMMRTEIEGTRNAMEAAGAAKVSRIVYTSTSLTIGAPRGAVGDESTPHRGYFWGSYERAKYEAEQLVMNCVAEGLPVVLVNPSATYGPGDLKPSGRALIDILNGRVPMLFRSAPFGIVYLDDVARGHLLAADRGRIGERYILNERNVTVEEFARAACRIFGRDAPRTGPAMVSRCVAELGELAARFTRRPPLLARDNFRLLEHGAAVEGSKAASELGLRYTPLEEWLPATIEWYWRHGYLKTRPSGLPAAT